MIHINRTIFRFSNTLSYIHQTSGTPLVYRTVEQQLRIITNQYPESLAVSSIHQGKQFTYAQFYEKSKQLAASLISLGLQKQDRVGIYSPNNYEWVLTQFAASMADLVLVNINPAYQLYELEYALNKVQCKALITASKFKHSNYIDMIRQLAPESMKSRDEILKSKKLPYLQRLIMIEDEKQEGFINFHDLFDRFDQKDLTKVEQVISKINPDSVTNIQFTSGTTGTPKGAALTHMNIVNNGRYIGERCRYTNKDRVCIPVPLYHCFGMVLGNMSCIGYGSAMVFPSEGFNAKAALEAITQFQCTSLYGVPTMFIDYLKEYEKQPNNYDISSLRTGIIAGSLATGKLMNDIIGTLGIRELNNFYGMTETSPCSTSTHTSDTFERRISTVGQPLAHLEVKIVDESGHIVPRGTPGEYCVRGYSVMREYWGDLEETQKTIDKSGFLHSGDICVMDHDNYLTIVGRSKDMIIRGGENIYPKEIEDFLSHFTGVEQVQVVGCVDEKYGEEVAAIIKMKDGFQNPTRNQIYDFCHKKIAHYKIPKFIKYVNEFPTTITGKPQKFKMRETLNEELKNPKIFNEYKIK